MMFHGYELTSEWKVSTCGQTAKARKGGKNYILKKYKTYVAPINNGTLDAKTMAHNQKLFDEFVSVRKRINAAIRSLAGPGGNIIIPGDEFIEGNEYVEASEFIDGAVSDDELEGVLASLSVDVKKLLMKTAAGALSAVHSKGIIHSDLKTKNVLLVRNKFGNYVAKLIDFDSSYFVDQKPEEIIGTIDYYSPELGAYADAEDDDDMEEKAKKITEKTDIFSLGLIFHLYLSGSFPTPISLTESLRRRQEKGKIIYCWVALLSGCDLELSPAIKDPQYISLIRDMLSLDPDARPSASEVLRRLQIDDGPGKGPGKGPDIDDPWPEHRITLDKDKLKAEGKGLKRKVVSGEHKYELTYSDGKKETVSKEDLISRNYAKSIIVKKGFCPPWPEHKITFDEDKLLEVGFVSSEQEVFAGVKGYRFYKGDTTSRFFRLETLLLMKYARKESDSGGGGRKDGGDGDKSDGSSGGGPKPEVFDPPWPEHKIEFDIEAIKAHGYISEERDTMSGINGYKFTPKDGQPRFMRVEMVLLQKMARKL